MADPPQVNPLKTPTTFLALPSELRQKFIFEGYNAIEVGFPQYVPRVLPYVRTTIQNRPGEYCCLDVARSCCVAFLKTIEIFTTNLEERYGNIVEDVEYVVDKLEWISGGRAIIAELDGMLATFSMHEWCIRKRALSS